MRRRAVLILAGSAVGLVGASVVAALAIGSRPGAPPTVQRWVIPAEFPRDRAGGWNPAPPIVVALRTNSTARASPATPIVEADPEVGAPDAEPEQPDPPPDLNVVGEIGSTQMDAARAKLRALVADRNRHGGSLTALLLADNASPIGRVVTVVDLLRGTAHEASRTIEEVQFSCDFSPGAGRVPPIGGSPREPQPLPCAGTAERRVVAAAASLDLYIARDGTLRVRSAGSPGASDPIPIARHDLAGELRASARGLNNATSPHLFDLAVFIHADTETPMGQISRSFVTCARVGIWRLAFVVQPPDAAAGGK